MFTVGSINGAAIFAKSVLACLLDIAELVCKRVGLCGRPCPNAPDSLLPSSTIWSKVSCFWSSDNWMNDLPYSSFAAVFLVVSVAEMPRAASFS